MSSGESYQDGRRKGFKDGYEQGKFDAEMNFRYNTPPTEQEVCEALSEYYDTKVYYEEQEYGTSFYLGKVKKDMNGKEYTVKRTIVCSYEGEIVWNASLPPHLITLIGRFYEGRATK